MAIDARIPLQAQSSNIGGLVMKFADDMQRQKLNEQQIDLQRQNIAGQSEARELQRRKLMADLEKSGQQEAAQRSAEFTARVLPVAEQDPAQAAQMLQKRIAEGEAAGHDMSHSKRQLGLFNQDPKAFVEDIKRDAMVAQQIGLLEPPPERYEQTTVNGMPAQVSTRTGKVSSLPGTPSALERQLGGMRAELLRSRIDAQNDAASQRQFEAQQKREAAEEAKRKRRLEETEVLREKENAYTSIVNDADFIKEQVALAKELAGFMTTGIRGELMAKFGANDAADLRAVVETLKARNAFQALADLAERGVKLTPISNEEIKLAAASLGSLDPNTSPPFLKRQLDGFLKRYERTLGKARVGLRRTIRDLEGRVAPEDMESAVETADKTVINFDDLPD